MITSCILVGCGGIGSLLAEPLARLLAWHPAARGATLTLCDGDSYEAGNASRQLYSAELEGENKARATTGRIRAALGQGGALRIERPLEEYARADVLEHELLRCDSLDRRAHVLLVLAADNHATHREALDAADAVSERSDVTILRPGNGAGARWGLVTVSAYATRAGQRITSDPRMSHPEIGSPHDRVPGGGCAAVVASEPQRLASNALAAALALAYVSALLDDRAWPEEMHGELGDGLEDRGTAWRCGPAGPMISESRESAAIR